MQKKVLFCATVDYHFEAFHLPYLKWFKEQGWEVHVAAAGEVNLPYVDKKYNIPIHRSPLKKMNLGAYKELKSIIDNNQYKIIHCHTPMGGVLTRLAAKNSRKHKTKVIYTAHGFHFCKGAPFLNWLLYYPIEKILSPLTDCLITINQEDYNLALSHHFNVSSIEHVHGVGVDTEIYKPADEEQKTKLRESLGYKPNDFLMFYAAEFNKNKNQKLLIKSLIQIKKEVPKARLLLAGKGHLLRECQDLARTLRVDDMIDFLGFRNDIESLLKISDIAVASSLREGLPVNILEAMACGLPVVATKNRGHSELIVNDENGFIIPPHDSREFANRILQLYQSNEQCERMRLKNLGKVKYYSLSQIIEELKDIYTKYMVEDANETESKHNRAYI